MGRHGTVEVSLSEFQVGVTTGREVGAGTMNTCPDPVGTPILLGSPEVKCRIRTGRVDVLDFVQGRAETRTIVRPLYHKCHWKESSVVPDPNRTFSKGRVTWDCHPSNSQIWKPGVLQTTPHVHGSHRPECDYLAVLPLPVPTPTRSVCGRRPNSSPGSGCRTEGRGVYSYDTRSREPSYRKWTNCSSSCRGCRDLRGSSRLNPSDPYLPWVRTTDECLVQTFRHSVHSDSHADVHTCVDDPGTEVREPLLSSVDLHCSDTTHRLLSLRPVRPRRTGGHEGPLGRLKQHLCSLRPRPRDSHW